ncbi:MAG: protein kinase [Acidobacteriota bacterium]
MTPERWKQVDELLEATLDLSPGERAEFLNRVCAGDEALRREVELLLSAHERADSFIEELPVDAVTELFADGQKSLVEGESINQYRIISRLGAGGMGEVYLAQDTRLARKVAIKFLPPESLADERARKRLIREAQAVATLDHPNICSIYEVGEEGGRNFIVMQYVEGETLHSRIHKEPPGLKDVLDIAIQVADALREAHLRGIIHRDIKPQNIMLTVSGWVKVVDFGLAKVVREQAPVGSEADTDSLISQPGSIAGTPAYMSPEQVKGELLDARSDLFSFGTVLYEMVSGHQPFAAGSAAETISAILTREPPPLALYAADVPTELQRIIHKTLEKDREGRYQSAHDLFIDLRNLRRDIDSGSAVATTEKVAKRGNVRRLKLAAFFLAIIALIGIGFYFLAVRPDPADKALDSIAVLPFANASEDANAEYLGDGITESIINSLSQLPQLRVMARTTVFRYKGRDVDPKTVGRDLGVRAVVTGRVLRVGDNLNIQTELVNTATGSQLWGQKYTRKAEDIFAVQEEMASEISAKLRLRLGDQDKQRLAKRYTDNPKAYELYLMGRYHLNRWTEEDFKKGIAYMQKALAEEPRYALAYAALAQVYSLGVFSSTRETYQAAKDAANKALEIDETLAEAHTSLAISKMYLDWDWSGAEQEFKRAIELNPGNATAHHWYGWYLGFMARFDESLAELRQAQHLDPLDQVKNGAIAITLYWAGEYDLAIKEFQKGLDLNPNGPGSHLSLAEIYARKGRFQEALAECQKAGQPGRNPIALSAFGRIYALSGKRAEAKKLLNELKDLAGQRYVPGYIIATLYAALGDNDRALEWLEKDYKERSALMAFIKVEPGLDSLRSNPRFIDLLRRVGFSQ